MDAEMPLLCLTGVTKHFGGYAALKGVDLEIRAGEFVCLVGPSGCGKSTLLRIIAGLARPTEGQVIYRNEPVAGVNPYTTIVFQTFALFPWLTVIGNVMVALQARGLPPPQQRQVAERLVGMVGLDGFESAYPRELSGGMRQKVGFARAMAVEPELLCLDEPFSALDVLSAETLRGELLELWLERKIPTRAILMVTHNIEEAVLLADRIVVMSKDPGRVRGELPVRLRHPRGRKDTAVLALVDRVYAAVTQRTAGDVDLLGTAPGVPGVTRKLPAAPLERIGGLTEAAVETGGRGDLPRFAERLGLGLNELLSIVEAAERLGLARVEQGDLILTHLGRTYAEASIAARKQLIAARIFRVPLVRWVFETLEKDDDQRIDLNFFTEALEKEFGDEAGAQVDIALSWGRFAELFDYDNERNELFLASQA